MNCPASLADLEAFVRDGVPESVHLDYKDSRALAKNARDEIAKDVSAFANSDGGILIYGVIEKDHEPIRLDDGVPEAAGLTREWLDQILGSVVTPRIPFLRIIPIQNSAGCTYFVIEVPKSMLAPHQAPDKKYYKRYNFRSSPMEHYEIVDVGNRRIVEPRLLDVRMVHEGDSYSMDFVVQNIGNRVARDVRFNFPDGFEWPKSFARTMPVALSKGIRFFPPGRRFSFMYCDAHEVWREGSTVCQEFELGVAYTPEGRSEEVFESSLVSLVEFEGTRIEYAAEDRLGRVLENGLRTVADRIRDPVRDMLLSKRPPKNSGPPQHKRWRSHLAQKKR